MRLLAGRTGTLCFSVEPWAACSACASASLALGSAGVSDRRRESVSRLTGAVSDKYGRRRVLLATMVGNLVSAAIWLRSTAFVRYVGLVVHMY